MTKETKKDQRSNPLDENVRRDFPKSNLFMVRFFKPFKFYMPFYTRLANAGELHFPGWRITWRLPYHPNAAFEKGWDACFRQSLKSKQREMN